MKSNLYNNNDVIVESNQDIYDNFNNFIFSKDRDVFNKLMSRNWFYDMTQSLPGDIVECGVFKGSGLITWLKLLEANEPHSLKKVIGFDYFSNDFVDDLDDETDRKTMMEVFTRDSKLQVDDISWNGIYNKMINAGIAENKFELVKGDVSITSKKFVEARPGFRISILYLDMDLYKPTYDALIHMWDRVVTGGVVVFDEYGYHAWSESNAVDQFVREYGVKLCRTNIKAPTAYIVKT